MICDALLQVSNAQAFSSDAASTSSIDLGDVTPKRDISIGEPLAFACAVDVAADATTGDETYAFQVIQSANADLSSPDILSETTIARATLVAGFLFALPLPIPLVTKRYVGIFFNGGGTTPTITLTAFLQPMSMLQNFKVYDSGYTVS